MKLETPLPDLQISFHERVQELRCSYLLDALLATVAESDVANIDDGLRKLVDKKALAKVAGWGLRGEVLFAVPIILEAQPRLLGYYRLLLGFSKKQFYGKGYGLGPFKSMEDAGTLSKGQQHCLVDLCACLCASAEYFVGAVASLSQAGVHDLTLLTLGPQLRGGALNTIGQKATREVFDLIKSMVEEHIEDSDKDSMEIRNAARRRLRIAFATDPDIAIHEELASGKLRPIIAVEIKGGRDVSNIHNRIGEAEKSHQKARAKGFTECWTIVGVPTLDLNVAHKESPSTDRFFVLDEVTDEDSKAYDQFREELRSRLGVGD